MDKIRKNKDLVILKMVGVFGTLYMFLVGIKGMSSAIKHMGAGAAESIFTATSDPFIALFIADFVAVFSTISAFAASTVHDFFNILAILILFPLEMMFHGIQRSATWFTSLIFGKVHNVDVLQAKSPIKVAVKTGSKYVEQFTFDNDVIYLIVSVLITFLMLYSLVKLLRSLVLQKIGSFFDSYIFKTAFRAISFGIVLTIMVQSSSITTSLVVPLAGAGVLTLNKIFPFTLGANIGTTVTALLAALTGTVSALIAAISHLLFNIFGILTIYGIPFLRTTPIKCAELISKKVTNNMLIPIMYLLIVFVAIPLSIILISNS